MLFQDKSSSCRELLSPLAGVCAPLMEPAPPASFLDPSAAPPAPHLWVAWGFASAVESMAQDAEVSLLCDSCKTCRSVSCTGGSTSKVAEHADGRTVRRHKRRGGGRNRWQNRQGSRTSTLAEEDCRTGKVGEEVRWQNEQVAGWLGCRICRKPAALIIMPNVGF